MQPLIREVQQQEQTQELRVSDGMPDIGSVLSAWGQVILRGKEWDGDTITVTGGTMAWVQYLPEEGGTPEMVECWLPFQMRWTIPATQRDGVLLTQTLLKSVDARSTSARKMIVRANVSVLVHALEPSQKDIYLPGELPEDIQLRTESYPVLLTAEAGEKAFALEETFTPQQPGMQIEKLGAYWLQPEVTEHRIMGDKVVFRGSAALHVLYHSQDGRMHSGEFQLPFSQYGELDREYADDAEAVFWPAVTALEAEMEEDRLHVKAGIVGQYEIRNRPVIRVVEDAYSPNREVMLQREQLELPGILESKNQTLHARLSSPTEGMSVAAVQFLPQPAAVQRTADGAQITTQGQFQGLQYDLEGQPQGYLQKWQEQMQLPLGDGAALEAVLWPSGRTQASVMSGQLQQQSDLWLQTDTRMEAGIPMVTGLELGEVQEPDPGRPSLILCRAGERSLWELAKSTRSTVEDIQKANDLHAEPEENQMLLIPVR